MQPQLLTLDSAIEIAELWIEGARESARTAPMFLPAIPTHEYARSLHAEFEKPEFVAWGIRSPTNNQLLGYLTARVTEPAPEFHPARFLYLLDLDVHHEHRRKGVATRLVAQARQFAEERALAGIEVSWLSGDPQSSAFWKSQGFIQYMAKARFDVPQVDSRRLP